MHPSTKTNRTSRAESVADTTTENSDRKDNTKKVELLMI